MWPAGHRLDMPDLFHLPCQRQLGAAEICEWRSASGCLRQNQWLSLCMLLLSVLQRVLQDSILCSWSLPIKGESQLSFKNRIRFVASKSLLEVLCNTEHALVMQRPAGHYEKEHLYLNVCAVVPISSCLPHRAEVRSTAELSTPHLEAQVFTTAQLPRWHHKLKCAERTRCVALRSCWAWDSEGELRQSWMLPTQLREGPLPQGGPPQLSRWALGLLIRAACGAPGLGSTQSPSALLPEGWSPSQAAVWQKTEHLTRGRAEGQNFQWDSQLWL